MRKEQAINLCIDPGSASIRVSVLDESSITVTKEVSLETLIDCVRGSIKRDVIRSGLLPSGCISFTAGEDNARFVTLLHPERYTDLTYQKTVYPHFPLPRLVFGFTLYQGCRVQSCRMGIVAAGRLTPETPMFRYPFSNVSGTHLCMGNNVLPKCESLHTLSSLPYFILEAPNNDDHFNRANNRLGLEFRDLLTHLRDKQPDYYDSNILVSSGKTLNDFIKEN